ncbi:prepilin peptidase [Streptomyces alkaliterrae]|uniref:Prepilin peptidase n=1 Tax=Streptomyces alkaliterrae TaxID=2213162 RepID=A0A5P0YZP3_9ACTN|nr:A24 family peptidase [Streptomyces alkaliterrae]MBB1262369.1 prepilin peptidase [Streptomyces alkaliterrae]MQS05222.1 prepilin peptidase [Streptomyces alkaliterrae]
MPAASAAPAWGPVAVAAVYGWAVGALLLPRAAHRYAVPTGEPWRTDHPPAASGRSRLTALPAPVTAVVCALLAATVGPRPELAVWLALAPALVLLAIVDVRVRRLPDVLTLPTAGAAAALLGVAAALPGTAGSWPGALAGGLVLGGGYLALFLIHPRGMGMGDVKLALTVGVALGWYGWTTLAVGALAGLLLGALYGNALLIAGRADRKTGIPFGPFLAAGGLLGVAFAGLDG